MTMKRKTETAEVVDQYMPELSDGDLAKLMSLSEAPGWAVVERVIQKFYGAATLQALSSVRRDEETAVKEIRYLSYGVDGSGFVLDLPNRARAELERRTEGKKKKKKSGNA